MTVGQRVRVLGEGFSQEDEEDMAVAEVLGISLGVGRFSIEISRGIAGNWILLISRFLMGLQGGSSLR